VVAVEVVPAPVPVLAQVQVPVAAEEAVVAAVRVPAAVLPLAPVVSRTA